MSPEILIILMFITLLIPLLMGLPLSFALGSVATIFTYFTWGTAGFYAAANQIFSQATSEILLAVPLFVFMGSMLKTAGIADELYGTMYKTIGMLNGGLAVGTVIVCTIFAAMAGITAVATVTMGLIAFPIMFKRGYNKRLALGSIAAAGGLGILIPPSVTMILYAQFAQLSVGKLFAAGMIPGFLLAVLYSIYIFIRSYSQPSYAPALPKAERSSLKEIALSLRSLFWPSFIITLVLGTIYGGICTPTEASAIGASGTIVAVIANGKFTWLKFRESCFYSLQLTVMVMWIVIASGCFSVVFNSIGAQDVVARLAYELPGGRWVVFILCQLMFFILGLFLDPTAIVLISTPILAPIVVKLGFDPIWFGVIFIVNMQMAYISPPFGYNLFYLRSIVPKGITMSDIYLSVIPFIAIIALALLLITIFPPIILWLPNLLIR